MNHATVAGHLGSDPETRFTSSGQKVTTFRVGCKSRKEESIWWRVTIWGEQFDKMLPYFKKGSAIVVCGEMMPPEIFQNRDGNTQVSLALTASHISFNPFGKPKSEEGGVSARGSESAGEYGFPPGSSGPAFEPMGGGYEVSDEDIPF